MVFRREHMLRTRETLHFFFLSKTKIFKCWFTVWNKTKKMRFEHKIERFLRYCICLNALISCAAERMTIGM